MIIEYHRATSLDDALALIVRQKPITLPLGGGTFLSQHTCADCAVVDLQDLKLDKVEKKEGSLSIGSALSLYRFSQLPDIPEGLRKAVLCERGFNLRQVSTIAGVLVTSDGRSSLASALLAIDASFVWLPGENAISLEGWLSSRVAWMPGKLITQIVIPSQVSLWYESVARSPMDRPLLSIAISRWFSGRTRIVVGGFGEYPVVVLDQFNPIEAENSADDICHNSQDALASAEYRQTVARVLIHRIISRWSK